MKLSKHKLGFRNQTVLQKLAICRRFLHAVQALPEDTRETVQFARCQSQLAAATEAVNLVETLRGQLRAAVTDRNQKVEAACRGTTGSALAYSSLGKSEHHLLQGGLDLIHRRKTLGRPAMPPKFHSQPTRLEGAVSLRWVRPMRRCAFVVQISTNPGDPNSWQHGLTCSTTDCLIDGLTPGARYWFRVMALNRYGNGPWTQPLPVRAA